MPPPQARTVSLSDAPAPTTANAMAATVSIMQTTHESGIHRWVARERRSPTAPTAPMSDDSGDDEDMRNLFEVTRSGDAGGGSVH